MKKNLSTIILFLVFFIGMSLLLYPSFSNWWNSIYQTRVVTNYIEKVANMDNDQYEELWNAAWNYNRSLFENTNNYLLNDAKKEYYEQLLNVSGDGVMGYIEIPKTETILPLYHGTDEAVLQIGAGHVDWTSLPVGGEGSHCVISGHRGLPSARLFTDLDQIQKDDTFRLHVLDEVLTYEVEQIRIVEPQDTQELLIKEGRDLCTLVTCTPYGINSHRMLIRGHRIETEEDKTSIRVTADAIQIDPIIITPMMAAPLLLIFFVGLFIPKSNNRRRIEK